MKGLGILALVLGVAAVGVAAYGMIETLPNFEYNSAHISSGAAAPAGTKIGDLERLVLEDYRDALGMQGMIALACGGLALVTGLVAALKGKVALGWGGVVLGVAGAVMGAMLFP